MPSRANVSLYRGDERTSNLRRIIEPILDNVDWSTVRHAVIKPNLVLATRPHAITHRDALETVLQAVRDRYAGTLTVAEGCALTPTLAAFQQQGYPALVQRYNCRLLDLNADESAPVTVWDRDGQPLHLQIARTVLESDCRISLSLPKTHDTVIATMTIKNMIMASLVNRRLTERPRRAYWADRLGQIVMGHGNGWGSDKVAMHQSYAMMNINLARLAPLVWPHISILDGFVAMEGAGPIDGDPVSWGIALAGRDALAVDATAARLMGFEVDSIGYLHYCAQLQLGCAALDAIAIVGNVAAEDVTRRLQRHPTHAAQRRWRHPDAARWLRASALAQVDA